MTKRQFLKQIEKVPMEAALWVHDDGCSEGSRPLKSVEYLSLEDSEYDDYEIGDEVCHIEDLTKNELVEKLKEGYAISSDGYKLYQKVILLK